MSLATESLPVVIELVATLAKIVNANGDKTAELDALESAAEALKLRMDQLKFPNESKL